MSRHQPRSEQSHLQTLMKLLRDWSLNTGREGGYKTGGGAREFLPLRKGGGGGKSCHSLKGRVLGGGCKQFWTCNFPIL